MILHITSVNRRVRQEDNHEFLSYNGTSQVEGETVMVSFTSETPLVDNKGQEVGAPRLYMAPFTTLTPEKDEAGNTVVGEKSGLECYRLTRDLVAVEAAVTEAMAKGEEPTVSFDLVRLSSEELRPIQD